MNLMWRYERLDSTTDPWFAGAPTWPLSRDTGSVREPRPEAAGTPNPPNTEYVIEEPFTSSYPGA